MEIIIITIFTGLTLLAWPLLAMTSGFLFDNPTTSTDFIFAYGLFAAIWVYPVIAGFSIFFSFRKRSVLIGLIPLILVSIALTLLFVTDKLDTNKQITAHETELANLSHDFQCPGNAFLTVNDERGDISYRSLKGTLYQTASVGTFDKSDPKILLYSERLTDQSKATYGECRNEKGETIFDLYRVVDAYSKINE